jgi:hypothetical protein
MNCPTELSSILLEMLFRGHVLVRAHGYSGRANLCAVEADHLHNLPDLIWDYSEAKLYYYWAIERPAFAENNSADYIRENWEPLWERLRPFAEPAECSDTEF